MGRPQDVNNMQKVLVEKYGFKQEAGCLLRS